MTWTARSLAGAGERELPSAGDGTPREIAELLADLLRCAGFQAEVVEAPQADSPAAAQVLHRAKSAAFAPALDDGTLAAVQRALNLPPPQLIQPADPDGPGVGGASRAAAGGAERTGALPSALA